MRVFRNASKLEGAAAVVMLLNLLMISPAMAQQGTQGAKWSRDGKFITFAAVADGDDWEIFIMRSNGEDVRQLTRNDHTDLQPTFSNDGEIIYFTQTQDRGNGQARDWDIARISVNGGEPERVFGDPGFNEYHPAELPDGHIACSRRPINDAYDSDLRVWDPETQQTSYLIDESAIEPRSGLYEIKVTAPATGDRFLFNSRRNGHNEIFSAKLDGSDIEQLTAVFREEPDRWFGHAAPSVSADGRYYVAWTDQPSPKPANGDPQGYLVYEIYDREKGQSRFLPKNDVHRFIAYPGLSPDGSNIAFAAAINPNGPTGLWGIFVQDVRTGEVTELWRQPEE